MSSADMVRVSNLTYEYPGTRALNDVSFTLAQGSVTALVGPNGAGKSTLLRCMAALDQPLTGQIEIDGIDVLDNPRECHRRLGYLSDFFGLYDSLTVHQSLTYAALSQGMSEGAAAKAALATTERLQLREKSTTRCNELSRGQRQRVAIGQALVHAPALLILDEPASGLDPEARSGLATIFRQLRADGMTLVVSSHILAELDEYSTHMLVIRGGEIIENRQLDQGPAGQDQSHVRIEFATATPQLAESLKAVITPLTATALTRCEGTQAVFAVGGGNSGKAALLRALVLADLPVIAMGENKENLQASYLRSLQESRQ